MADESTSRRERWISLVGAGASLVFMLSLGELIYADSWSYALGALAVAAISGAVVAMILREVWPSGSAPRNTQLQNPPPAIVRPASTTGKEQ
jgi:hypothetical protein